jgi:hypothetical protein
VCGGEAVAGQDQPSSQDAAQDADGCGDQHAAGHDVAFSRQDGDAVGHRGQCGADQAGAVFATDCQHCQDCDDSLAELDAGEAELGGIDCAAGRGAGDRRDRQDAQPRGQRGGAQQQPGGSGHGALFRPLRVQGLPHASLRRSR